MPDSMVTPDVKKAVLFIDAHFSYQMERQGGNRMGSAELGTYVNTRSIQSFEYEPHGKRISFISDWKGSPQVWEYDNSRQPNGTIFLYARRNYFY